MKYLLILLTALTAFSGVAQTPLIAHKSHSGAAATFFIDPNTNFGKVVEFPEPVAPEVYNSYEPLNDSTVVKRVTDKDNNIIAIDTLPNKQRHSIGMFQYEYERQLEIRYRDSIMRLEDSIRLREYQESQKEESVIIGTPKNDSNPPSFLLIVLAVSSAGMIIIRLMGRSTSVPVVR